MAKKDKVAKAFADIREALKARANNERDVMPEITDAGLDILEQFVRDIHAIASNARLSEASIKQALERLAK